MNETFFWIKLLNNLIFFKFSSYCSFHFSYLHSCSSSLKTSNTSLPTFLTHFLRFSLVVYTTNNSVNCKVLILCHLWNVTKIFGDTSRKCHKSKLKYLDNLRLVTSWWSVKNIRPQLKYFSDIDHFINDNPYTSKLPYIGFQHISIA